MIRNRQCIVSIMATGAILVFAASAAVAAAHPAIGTWQLNLAKSTDESTDASPKSETFTFADTGKGVTLTTRIVGADGKLTVNKGNPIKWDGMAHPDTNGPDHDSITVTPAGAQTLEWAFTKKGASVRSGTLAVSRDGRMMTISGASMGAKGGKTYFNDVFERK
ncbi:MAG TPA: hypothetical protein VMO78_09345 [Rhizomicrobium sp.]|nr:hypothetical protein [Rhizomicrobium sp.]